MDTNEGDASTQALGPEADELPTLSECIQQVLNLQFALDKAGGNIIKAASRIQKQTEADMILMDDVRKRYEGYVARC